MDPVWEGVSDDDIVLAANLFSQNQTGALIVIERDTGLQEYIDTGIPMDSLPSPELLLTCVIATSLVRGEKAFANRST